MVLDYGTDSFDDPVITADLGLYVMIFVERIKVKIIGSGDAHSQNRNKNIFRGIFSTVLARLINIGSGLVTVPITLKYLGTEQFALWMAITSFVGFLSFADFGLGIGLQNALARCFGTNNKSSPAYYISTTYFLLFFIALVLVFVAIGILPLFPVGQLIKVEADASRNLILPTLQVFIVIFAMGLPIGIIQRVLIGYQKSHISGYLLVVGRLLGLLSIFISIWAGATLPVLTGLFIGLPFVVQFIFSLFYYKKHSWLMPSISRVGIKYLKEVSGTGLWSVLAQVTYTIKMNVPLLIISASIGAVAVAQYSITQRLIGVSGMLISLGLQPLWPAYGEAYYRGDKQWLVNTFKKSVKVVLVLSIPVFLIMSFAGIPIIALWTGEKDVVPSFSLLMACNVWMIIMNWNVSCAMVLNGSNHLKGQATYGLSLTILACFFALLYGVNYGASGVIWTIVIVSELLFSVFLFIEVNSVIKGMK